jgi:HTH-type transcriptional regulator / antitoxin HigA
MPATVIDSRYAIKNLPAPKVITSETQHEQYVSTLLNLDRRGHLSAEEKSYAELLTVLIDAYEEEQHPIRAASPVEVLTALMSANNLRQRDLVDVFGTESVVSEVLHGRRSFAKTHIQKLSKRFNVSPEMFFDLT